MDVGEIRKLLAKHGRLKAQLPAEWKGEFSLPESVEAYFSEIGPMNTEVEAIGNPWFLPKLSALWKFQEGYRWNGLTKKRNDDWPDDWLAVATDGDGVFVLSRASGAVSYASHGEGAWEPVELFPDVLTMAACFGVIGGMVRDAGDALVDDSYKVLPEYQAKLKSELEELIGTADKAELAMKQLGFD